MKLLLIFVALPAFASLSNVYVAQTSAGGNTGVDCADAFAISFFTTSGNWGVGGSQIGAGTTVHLCGNVTTALTFLGSGSAGNPITIKFETGASMSTTVWGVAITMSSQSYVVVDGGVACGPNGTTCNGFIANTNNGTSGSHSNSQGIVGNSCTPGCEVKNLGIYNIYVHSGTGSEIDQTQVNCIVYSGSGFLVHDNTMHDAGWCLYMNNGDASNQQVYNNNMYNIDHGIAITPGGNNASAGPWYFYANHVHDYANWDTSANTYHHDGIHCYTVTAGGAAHKFGAQWADMWIYNNIFDGNIGSNVTGHIFLEPGVQTDGSATPCMNASAAIHIFGNVFLGSTANGTLDLGAGGSWDTLTVPIDFYNNTSYGPGSSDATSGRQVVFENVTTINAINNIVGGSNKLWDGVSFTNTDYNGYINCPTGQSFNCWPVSGGTNNFSTWKSVSGADGHAINSQANFDGVTSTTGLLTAGSVMIGAGTNLTSAISGWPAPQQAALLTDLAGNARGSSWAIGAYQFSSGAVGSKGGGNIKVAGPASVH